MTVMNGGRYKNLLGVGSMLVAALGIGGVVAHFVPPGKTGTAAATKPRDTGRAAADVRATVHPQTLHRHQVTGTIAAAGGGPGSALADLSQLTPVQVYNVSGVSDGKVRIGATTYADSVRFTCDSGSHESSGDLDYVVTGYGSMTATLGVPSYDTSAAGDTMTVSFNNNGSGAQLDGPVTVTPGHPQQVRVRFRQASQLEISCTSVSPSGAARSMDLALGNAVIGP
jgi:hypothetical protein